MKNFIKGRWFPLVAASIVVAFIIRVMILCGWRFTYAPELENNWDAVSGVAAWFGVAVSILSAAASFAAIWFAVRVADQQNIITLFEKRYWLYMSFKSVEKLAIFVQEYCENSKDVREFYRECFLVEPTLKTEVIKADFSSDRQRYDFLQLRQNVNLLHLFFKDISYEDEQCIYNIISALHVVSQTSSDVVFKKHKEKLTKTIGSFNFEKVLNIMESQLKQV